MRNALIGLGAVAFILGGVSTVGPVVTMVVVVITWVLAGAWRRPLLTGYIWWIAVAIVPTWIGVGLANSQFVLGSVIAVALLPGAMAAAGPRLRLTPLDWAMLALVALMLVSFAGGGSRGLAADSIFQWGMPFLLFRLVSLRTTPDELGRMILRVGLFCALWALIEFLFGVHIFETVQLPGSLPNLEAVWQSVQTRGGVARSEASFGTSIALSGFLALAIPYALRLRLPWLLLSIAILGGGMLATLARTGAVAAAIIIGLTLIMRAQRYRLPLTVAYLAAAVYVAPIITGQDVDGATAADFQSSNGYRDYVFSTAIPQTNWFGTADLTFGAYVSVDNAYLRVALESGRVSALALIAVFAVALVAFLRYRDGAALTSAISMGASIYVVALITQWQMFIFAVLGIAATEIQRARESRRQTVAKLPVDFSATAQTPVIATDTRDSLNSAILRDRQR